MTKRRKQSKRADPRQLDLVDLIERDILTGERREILRGILASGTADRTWRGEIIVPPDTLLAKVVELFERTTDFPLEVPAFLTLHCLAAYLLDKAVKVRVAGTKVQTDLWTTILAPSGSGKTQATTVLAEVMPLRLLPEATSAARFIEEVAKNNRAAWFQDEWAQMLKRMNSQTYAEELKDYLLRIYDNRPIARRTAKGTIEIADPALVIVGTTVRETFLDNVSAESMLDGFMQRFQFVIGDPDPARPPDMFPIYHTMEEENLAPLHQAWDVLKRLPIHDEYVVERAAEEAFVDAFKRLFVQNREMPASFFRRIMWRSFKYAIVYHFLLAKVAHVIDAEDVGWAVRVSALHIADARRLLDGYNLNTLETLIRKAEILQSKLGRKPTPRELIAGIRGINNAAMAYFILEVITQPPAANAPATGAPTAPAANDNDFEDVHFG